MRALALAIATLFPVAQSGATTEAPHMPRATAAGRPAAVPGRLDFGIAFDGVVSRLDTISRSVMPGESLNVAIETTDGVPATLVRGQAEPLGAGRWRVRAPARPGTASLVWRHGEQTMTLHLLVMRPLAETVAGRLNGYRIGHYEHEPLHGLQVYEPPRGLVEVTRDMADLRVSPNFRLGDFLCKQAGGFPKYLLLRTRLLLKLEYLLARARAAGLARESFTVMSGYRTPFYNRAIGNTTNYSRHLYGGAVDVYVDESPRDGVMDDLNGDGRVDTRDAGVLYRLIDGQAGDPTYAPYVGGLARYPATRAHGPFVHLDARGYLARWGH